MTIRYQIDVLEIRFDPPVADQFAAGIRAIDDLQRLKQLRRSAVQVDALDEFQRLLDAKTRRDFPLNGNRMQEELIVRLKAKGIL